MRSEGGQQQRREDRNLLFEQGEECPARGRIRAGEEDRASARKNTGIKLAKVCWEGWGSWGAGPWLGGGARPRTGPSGCSERCALLTASSGYLRVT